MSYKYTAEELFELPEYKSSFYSDFGTPEKDSSVKEKIELDFARTENYAEGIFYHAGNGTGEAGLGKGLYLGKDKNALHNFYNLICEFGNSIKVYKGEPNFLDLTEPNSLENFEKEAVKAYGEQKNREHLRSAVVAKGFYGIRYFDPSATGEEFVLFNTDKVKFLGEENLSEDK